MAQLDAGEFARRVRNFRKMRRWTLATLSEASGVSISALSKIENEQVAASFDTLLKLSQVIGVSFETIVSGGEEASEVAVPASGRRTTTMRGAGMQFSTARYDYEVHSADLTHKRMIPLVMQIRARDVAPQAEWSSHDGEEFIYVTRGRIELHTEMYLPAVLSAGDSAYIDSRMRHAFINLSDDDSSEILSVCLSDKVSHQVDEIIRSRASTGS
ncbi:MAG: helix-turn-helix transcriptional regulator [Rhizobiales bacterium]|nr:helix-turn-helix transcriptional regulator [Hyphomicrobiales bacterium]